MSSTRRPAMNATQTASQRAGHHEPATAVFARQVKPGREAEYERLAQEMVKASEAFPGQLGATMLHESRRPINWPRPTSSYRR